VIASSRPAKTGAGVESGRFLVSPDEVNAKQITAGMVDHEWLSFARWTDPLCGAARTADQPLLPG
jgi:hypothetical protein